MKCIRSNLNGYFKENRGIHVISDPRFVQANQMMKGMTVKAKSEGKGVPKSTVPIDDLDLKKMNDYFNGIDYMNNSSPKVLLQTVLFNIIYYTCRRGIENLERMTKAHYKVIVEHDGTCYLIQNIDELDKNHREDCLQMSKEGKMYANPG